MNEDANQEAPVDTELVKLLLRQYGLNADEWPDDVEGYPREAVRQAKSFQAQTQRDFAPFHNRTQEEEDIEDEEYEAAVDFMRTTIDVPEPSTNADVVAEWMKSPDSMLSGLTAVLNAILKECRWFLAPDLNLRFEGNGWSAMCVVSLLHDTRNRIVIRNALEMTPFGTVTVDELICLMNLPPKERIADPVKLRDSVWRYERDLQCLADWIDVKASPATSDGQPKKVRKDTATPEDYARMAEELRDKTTRKYAPRKTVADALRKEGKSVSNGPFNDWYKTYTGRSERKSGHGR